MHKLTERIKTKKGRKRDLHFICCFAEIALASFFCLGFCSYYFPSVPCILIFKEKVMSGFRVILSKAEVRCLFCRFSLLFVLSFFKIHGRYFKYFDCFYCLQ
eukprot:TRINITY_DN13474_c0_g1_i1.p1 TRINITY_DN13474_c0_g1~~TRINITY_DN13474_c0_g1_i1.p1  ORF type:complete len:102 (+),score=3.92 TRINITY_DN13474_c0_g1_i1:229-534(+)